MHDPFGAHRLALAVKERLEAATRLPWSVSPSGSPEPRECWLHLPDHDEASVGVFAKRCVVWVDSDARTFPITNDDELRAAAAPILEAVAQQRARFREHDVASDRVTVLANALVTTLGEDLGRSFSVAFVFRPSHAGARRGTITDVATKRAVLELGAVGSRVFLRLGPLSAGADEIEADSIVTERRRIADRVAALLSGFSLRELAIGGRYRVLESIGGLVQGTVVRFARYDDVDNHYGAYVFVDEGDAERSVAGDFSSPQHHPFYETVRYLASV